MSTLSNLIDAGKQHQITFKNRSGGKIFDISLLWAVIISLAAPQVLPLVVLLYLLDVIQLEYDHEPIVLAVGKEQPPETDER